MARHHRRRHKTNLVAQTVSAANRTRWWIAGLIGVLLFAVFYWGLPLFIESVYHYLDGNPYQPIIQRFIMGRIHWVQWIGIALGLIGLFFAVRNFFTAKRLSGQQERDVGFVGKTAARLLD